MPGFLLHVGATVLCAHAGQAQPTVPNPRVTVSGQPIVMLPGPYVVAGCTLPPPPAANGPCVTAQWLDSQAICAPTGTPLLVTVTQVRVSGV